MLYPIRLQSSHRRHSWLLIFATMAMATSHLASYSDEPNLSATASEPKPAYPLWDGSESVADYAKRTHLPAAVTLTLGAGADTKMEFCLIPAGKFVMGSAASEPSWIGKTLIRIAIGIFIAALLAFLTALLQRRRPKFVLVPIVCAVFALGLGGWGYLRYSRAARAPADESPAHSVTISAPFYLAKFPTTYQQWYALGKESPPSWREAEILLKEKLRSPGDAGHPLAPVQWDDAIDFCNRFCNRLTKKSHWYLRLPSEAEWEYACRAGAAGAYYFGNLQSDLDRAGWYAANSNGAMHDVGQMPPNKFGLCDMHGNVWQWCADYYDRDYYGISVATDPHGPKNGREHVLRGGSFQSAPDQCRSASRTTPEIEAQCYAGFRPVLEIPNTFLLAMRCFHGDDVAKNTDNALYWFRQGAETGHLESQSMLARLLSTPEFGHVDLTEALKWAQKAADRNNKFAQWTLGEMYLDGQGVNKSFAEAVKWLLKSAEQDCTFADQALRHARIIPKFGRSISLPTNGGYIGVEPGAFSLRRLASRSYKWNNDPESLAVSFDRSGRLDQS